MSTTTRIDDIAKFLVQASQPVLAGKAETARLSEEMQTASANAINAREAMFAEIAKVASADSWTYKEVESACNVAAKSFNAKSTAKTFGTLAGEMKLAADEAVRDQFSNLVRLRDLVWGEEVTAAAAAKQAGLAPVTPCRLAFKRGYHMLVSMMRRLASPEKDAGVTSFATAADVLAFAEERDPRRDPEKVAAQIKAMRDNLAEFYGIFPVSTIKLMLDYAEGITAEDLKAELDAQAAKAAEAASAEDAAADDLTAGLDQTDDAAESAELTEEEKLDAMVAQIDQLAA